MFWACIFYKEVLQARASRDAALHHTLNLSAFYATIISDLLR